MILIKAILWEDDNGTKAIKLNSAFNFVCAQRLCITLSEMILQIIDVNILTFDTFLLHSLLVGRNSNATFKYTYLILEFLQAFYRQAFYNFENYLI